MYIFEFLIFGMIYSGPPIIESANVWNVTFLSVPDPTSHQTFQQEILHLFFQCQEKISRKKPPVRGQGKVRDRVRFRAWLAYSPGQIFS